MEQNQNPTPTEVFKLLQHLANSKPFYIAFLLECSGQQSEDLSEAFDQDGWPSALMLLTRLGDNAVALGVQKMKEANL